MTPLFQTKAEPKSKSNNMIPKSKSIIVSVTRYPRGVDISTLSEAQKAVVDYLLEQTSSYEWIPISKFYLQSIAGNVSYRKEIEGLIKMHIIECDEKYLPSSVALGGEGFPKSYRFNPRLIECVLNGDYEIETSKIAYTYHSSPPDYKIEFNSRFGLYSEEEVGQIKEAYQKFSLHPKWATGTFFQSDFSLLSRLDETFHGGVIKMWEGKSVGRIYSLIHALPKRLRHLLRIEGSPIKMYDATAAIPAIMASYIKSNPEEQSRYLDLVYGSGIYEKMVQLVGLKTFTRDDAKVAMQQWLSNGRCRKLWKVDVVGIFDEYIRSEFPTLHAVREENAGSLQANLQTLEAHLFVKLTCGFKVAGKQTILASIHDSIIVGKGYNGRDLLDRLATISKKELGFVLKLKKVDVAEEARTVTLKKIMEMNGSTQQRLMEAFGFNQEEKKEVVEAKAKKIEQAKECPFFNSAVADLAFDAARLGLTLKEDSNGLNTIAVGNLFMLQGFAENLHRNGLSGGLFIVTTEMIDGDLHCYLRPDESILSAVV